MSNQARPLERALEPLTAVASYSSSKYHLFCRKVWSGPTAFLTRSGLIHPKKYTTKARKIPRVPTATEEYIAYVWALCAICEASSCDSPGAAGAAAWGVSPEAEVPWDEACPCSPVAGADPREASDVPSFAGTASPSAAGVITAACSIVA